MKFPVVSVVCESCGQTREVGKYWAARVCHACRVNAPRPYQVKSLEGQRFGDLVALEEVGRKDRRAVWRCRCDCGNVKEISSKHLVGGSILSCGCRRRPHGRAGSSSYSAWSSMLGRTVRKGAERYRNHAGRGITVCERWLKFENFLADMGERPSLAYTIERIDNDGHYEPGNCRWATRAEQARNRRDTRMITIGDETLCLADWCKRYGTYHHVIKKRVARGMSVEEAIMTSARAKAAKNGASPPERMEAGR